MTASERMKLWRIANPDRAKANEARGRAKRRDKINATARKVYQERPNDQKWRSIKLKCEVMDAYGGRECKCCHETALEFLNVDHIGGGGNKHRAEIKRYGQSFYKWLKSKGFPAGYQVMCFNCNCARGLFGFCPHEINPIILDEDYAQAIEPGFYEVAQ